MSALPFLSMPGEQETPSETILKSTSGESIALRSVRVTGRLDNLLLSTVIRQNYRNETGKNLEIVYTFPVPWGARLVGMDVEIGGKRLQGVVIEKKEAEEKYEEAVDKGDTPFLIRESAPGLYTANLGNIKDKESVSIDIRCAQLLRFEQGQIRVKIPTVIAPRYGDAHKEGGLAPHETDVVDLAAEYPLTVGIDIHGEVAKAAVSSPSHQVSITQAEESVSVLLESGAMLDRDFILLLQELPGHSFALTAPDEDTYMMLAGFCPALPEKAVPLALKILVDCSGSMCGDSIREAKLALGRVLGELKPGDYVSYSRFGSDVQHNDTRLQACSAENLQRLAYAVAATDADMGGTEMEQALASVYKDIAVPAGLSVSPCILLITDDLVWNEKGILASALKSGHRIFTVGVGSSPAECLLRDMADKTGGACEFVTPREDVAGAVIRMFHRMRVAHTNNLRVFWGREPLWQSPLPQSVFDGETLHLFAAFAEVPDTLPILSWEVDGCTEHAWPDTILKTDNRDLVCLGGACRMETAKTPEEALALALKYRLVSEHTSLFLAYVREGDDKVTDLPVLHQVPQMPAKGSHGFGSVLGAGILDCYMCCLTGGYTDFDLSEDNLVPEKETNIFSGGTGSPQSLLEAFDREALHLTDFAEVLWRIFIFAGKDDMETILIRLARQEGIPAEQAWAVLLDWLLERFACDFTPSRRAKRLLRAQAKLLETTRINALRAALETTFPSVSLNAWAV